MQSFCRTLSGASGNITWGSDKTGAVLGQGDAMRVVAQVAGSCTQACKDTCQLPSGELIFAFTLSCPMWVTLGHLAKLEGCGT